MKTKFIQLLERIGACSGAISWVDEKSLNEAWATCERPDWLFWLTGKSNLLTEKDWRLLACSLARTALPYTTDPVVLATIEVAERFAVGEATREELNAVRSAANSAAYSAAYSADWGAASYAASYAAYYAARSAANSAANSAADYAACSAARSAARSAAWDVAQKEQCNLIRSKVDLKFVYEGLKKGNEDLFPTAGGGRHA